MQTIQISDQVANQLQAIAIQEHIQTNELVERLIIEYSKEIELKAFFKPYQTDMAGFKSDRNEANVR